MGDHLQTTAKSASLDASTGSRRALAWLAPLFLCALLAGASAAQAICYRSTLPAHTLEAGRIVLASGEFYHPFDDPDFDGRADNALDADPESAALLPHPGPPPQGTWLLLDLAMTHWPPAAPGEDPRPRRPVALTLYNGACTRCSEPQEFRRYARIRRARLEILHRRANRVDQEYVIPQAEPVWIREIVLEDRPGPQRIALEGIPLAPPSDRWPENMEYIIAKITILELYPGERFASRVGLAEAVYVDENADGADFVWQ